MKLDNLLTSKPQTVYMHETLLCTSIYKKILIITIHSMVHKFYIFIVTGIFYSQEFNKEHNT